MESKTVDDLWNKAISGILRKVSSDCCQNMEIDDNMKKSIYDKYLYYRRTHKKRVSQDKIMDRHKIASCFALSILHVKPLPQIEISNSQLKDKTKVIQYFSNELLSVELAQNIMKIFLAKRWKENKRPESDYKLLLSEAWVYPKSYLNESDNTPNYLNHFLKDLYYLQQKSQTNNFVSLFPLFSHLFFYMENYHIGILEEKLSL